MRAIKIINRGLALAVLLLIGCSGGSNTPLTQAKKISEVDVPQFEGSQSKPLQASVKKELETNLIGVHPGVKEEVKIDRGIVVPKEVKGQWKAVKIIVRNKIDETRSSLLYTSPSPRD